MSQTQWLNGRLSDVQSELERQAHSVSLPVISRLLHAQDYELRLNLKTLDGCTHPQRDEQFRSIAVQQAQHQAAGQPQISVDTKQKELIGDFKNAGRSMSCAAGPAPRSALKARAQDEGTAAEPVNMHDFPSEALGRAVPYGIYDEPHNRGTVYLGQSADTPAFAVDNIARWCESELPKQFPNADALLIKADGGGSNRSRSRVWKQQLQAKVADRFGLTITVCHYPTGTSQWNPIEHRLFSEISKTWAGCPLRSFALTRQYMRDTTTQTGLTVQAYRVTDDYPTGLKVCDEEMAALNLQAHDVCPQWNYTIRPRTQPAVN